MAYQRRRKPVVLSADERDKLLSWSRRSASQQRLAVRARIILSCAEGLNNGETAKHLNTHHKLLASGASAFKRIA